MQIAETRTLDIAEAAFRYSARDDGARRLVGYAAVFGKPSELIAEPRGERGKMIKFREVIQPGAFAGILASPDVRALFNHEPSQLLGRTGSGTLRLSEDAVGLRYEIDMPDTSLGRDVAELARRGDLAGSSFSYFAEDDWDRSGPVNIRSVTRVTRVLDVGPVTYPAYPDTTVALRSLEAHRRSRQFQGDGRLARLIENQLRLSEARFKESS